MFRSGALLVVMLTTAGEAFLAAALKLPGATPAAPMGFALSCKVMPAPKFERLIHSGFKVTSTNQTAKKTVTT